MIIKKTDTHIYIFPLSIRSKNMPMRTVDGKIEYSLHNAVELQNTGNVPVRLTQGNHNQKRWTLAPGASRTFGNTENTDKYIADFDFYFDKQFAQTNVNDPNNSTARCELEISVIDIEVCDTCIQIIPIPKPS